MSTKYDVLKNYFGHDNFREFQEEAVDAILAQRDLLMILPTGGGKSLCYQLPTLLMNGVTIVVSPLLALMHDQVSALHANDIEAAMISSMQSEEEISDTIYKMREGNIKLVYVAPERLVMPSFIDVLHTVAINFFVIDEAHCVSEWGHDFRADYRRLALLKENFPSTPVAAFTATATQLVKSDISKALLLQNPTQLQGVTFRKNLSINATYRHQNGEKQLLEFLKKHPNQAGIVYTLSRKDTEKFASFLSAQGFNAKPYHAGLSTEVKNRTFKDFVNDDVSIVVATIAFGMGIDKSNIRFVTHMSLPKTIENYYQEIGRAGRDGEDSETLLLFAPSDMVKQRLHINENPSEDHRRLSNEKLQLMMRLASSELCRHQFIAKYFEDTIDTCQTSCDFCTADVYEKEDISKSSQMFLSTILRTNSRFGTGHLIDILRGSQNQKIEQNSHQNLSVYGIGKDYDKSYWQAIAERLIELEAIVVGEYSVLSLTPLATHILKSKVSVEIKKERLYFKAQKSSSKIEMVEDENYLELKMLRNTLAKEQGVPPYVIFSDKTLHELSNKRPSTEDEMLAIHGIGAVKFEKYGEAFLELLETLIPEEEKNKEIEKKIEKVKIDHHQVNTVTQVVEEVIPIKIPKIDTQKIEIPKKVSTKKRSATYNETLELIQNNLTLQEITEHRGFTFNTILSHVTRLFEDDDISQQTKEHYFEMAQNSIPKEIQDKINDLQNSVNLNEFRNHLSLYILLQE
jgi:ATP-dependent DNA helicase RecQ